MIICIPGRYFASGNGRKKRRQLALRAGTLFHSHCRLQLVSKGRAPASVLLGTRSDPGRRALVLEHPQDEIVLSTEIKFSVVINAFHFHFLKGDLKSEELLFLNPADTRIQTIEFV